MFAGIAVSLAASLLGALPMVRAQLRTAPPPPFAALGSLAIRFLFALAAAAYLILNQLVSGTPFVVWLGISYLVLLPVDVLYALRCSRAASPSVPRDGTTTKRVSPDER